MTVGERIRYVRENCADKKISMAKFAEKIRVTSGAVSQWETGDKTPSKSAISLISREFNINENWLLTGEGDMYAPMDRLDEIAAIAANAFKDDDPVRLQLMRIVSELTGEQIEELYSIAKKIVDAKENSSHDGEL